MAAPSVKLWNPVGPGHQRFSKGSRYAVDQQSVADSIDSSESHLTTVFWHQAPRSSVLRSDTPTASRLLELPASAIPAEGNWARTLGGGRAALGCSPDQVRKRSYDGAAVQAI